MPCIKCGRKVEEGQVFCADCLAAAEKYPVKPGTPISLPRYVPMPEIKNRPKKRVPKPEEQIRSLRAVRNWLILALAVLLAAFALLSVLLLTILDRTGSPF